MKDATILLLDLGLSDHLCISLREVLRRSALRIEQDFLEVAKLPTTGALPPTLLRSGIDLVFLMMSPGLLEQAAELVTRLRSQRAEVPFIAVTDSAEPDRVFELLRAGVADFLTPPLKPIDILPRIWRLLDQNQRMKTPLYSLKEKLGMKQIIGQSPRFVAELKKFPTVAKCDASVLILGETGTGKELCARALHYLSTRASNPFVPVNCGAIPAELIENELFGHEREAFSGARTLRTGLIEEADSGTLFLDEIDCLPLAAQVKLLRFLQEKEYRRLGSTKMRRADVRVMAATNSDLQEAVRTQKLRRDLYYRLNVIPLVLPPLRERRDDIPLLARHFLRKYALEFDKSVADFSESAMQAMLLYDWPGNVRELEHVVERAVVLSEGEVVQGENIDLVRPDGAPVSFQQMKARVITQFERDYLQGLLLTYHGNITRAAEAAGKDRRALRQLIRKHKIDARAYRD